jgi:hypothetical protein
MQSSGFLEFVGEVVVGEHPAAAVCGCERAAPRDASGFQFESGERLLGGVELAGSNVRLDQVGAPWRYPWIAESVKLLQLGDGGEPLDCRVGVAEAEFEEPKCRVRVVECSEEL